MPQVGFDLAHLASEFGHLHLVVRRINDALRLVVIVDERKHPVVLLLRERIELVVVTLGALDGEAQHALADGVHAVEHRIHAELLRIDSAFLVDHRVAQKAGGDNLFLRRVWQLIARQLLDDELIVRQVAVQRVDHVIAVEPNLAALVLFETVGVRVTRGIEPLPAPALAVVRRTEQALDCCLVSILRLVGEEGVHFGDGWRQADQVQAQAAKQGDLVRGGCGLELFLFEPGEDKVIHRVARPVFARRRRRLRLQRRFEGPVLLPIFALSRFG